MVDADHMDPLVADLAQRVGGDNRRNPGRGHDAVHFGGMSGEVGADLFFRRFRRVDIGDDLNDFRAGFVSRFLHGIDTKLRVGVDKEAGEMGDAFFARSHRLDEFLGAEISRISGVGAKAEGGGRGVFEAAGAGNHVCAVAGQFLGCRDRADGIAGENQEAVISLAEQAFEKLVLLCQFPLLRHLIVGASQAEVLGRVLAGLFPGGEIRVRTARNEGDLAGVRRLRDTARSRADDCGSDEAAHEIRHVFLLHETACSLKKATGTSLNRSFSQQPTCVSTMDTSILVSK
ncbi:hypothetical protein D3C87_1250560 [compost metagenome]